MARPEHDLNLIAALLEGRLDDNEKAQVQAHLADCPECRATLALLAKGSGEGLLGAGAGDAAPRRWRSPAVWLPVAASVAVAAIALRLVLAPDTNTPVDTGTSAEPPAIDESLLPTRAAGRIIDGKTFRMRDGEWVDEAYASGAAVITIQGREAREELLARIPGLRRYTELGDRVIVVHQDTAYRFEP
jgi:Putative zinc-finger